VKEAKFELFQSKKNEEFYFHLKAAGNSEIILASEGYTTKANCLNGIESVKQNAPNENKFQRLQAENGEYYFNLIAGNGETIGSSETYKSKQGRDNGIKSVMHNAVNADVIDLTLEKGDSEHRKKEYEIIVNGRPKVVVSKELSFFDIVKLAFGEVISDGRKIYTMTFKKGVGARPEGILVEGDVIKIKKGVIFNVSATDKS
jgi:uncharacterized protein YegP (UPF0339 family)